MFKKGFIPKSKKVFIATMLVALSVLAFELAPIFTHQTARIDLPRHEKAALLDKEIQPPPALRTNLAPEIQTEPKISAKPEKKSRREPVTQAPIAARSLAEVESAPSAPVADIQPAVQAEEASPQSLVMNDFWIWAGAGVDFTSYSQTVPGLSKVSFGKIKSPTQVFHAGFLFDDRFGLDLGYKNIPGEATAGSSISVQSGSYEWKTLSAEALYRPSIFGTEPRKSEWIWRLGLQQHEMPFIVPLTANSIKISSNNMTTLSLGVEYRKLTKKNIRIETMFRYQHPIASSSEVGSSFSLSSPLIFDGSVGAAYQVKPNIYIGTYWHGQYQSNTFSYTNNSTSYSGNQSLFNSNFDLRLGVEF